MAILNIDSLKKLAKENKLLGDNYKLENFQPSSYDLRIGTIYNNNKIISADHPDSSTYYVEVRPSEIITMLTLEEVNMPHNCCGTVFALNNHSSTGLLILNPGHIDPSYIGPISVCAINLSKESIKISLNDKIFTLIVEKLNKVVSEKDRYKNKTLTSRKIFEENQYKTNFSKLSNSFFDLVVGYKDQKKLLGEVLYERFWHYVKIFLKILAAIATIAGILRFIYALYPEEINELIKNKETEIIKEKDYKINLLNLKLIRYKVSLSEANKYKDSIISSYTNGNKEGIKEDVKKK
jgi:deoxycytidine triphosphate deaminase